jgi:RNA polymerase sigma-70 factor (ECF subfamily)
MLPSFFRSRQENVESRSESANDQSHIVAKAHPIESGKNGEAADAPRVIDRRLLLDSELMAQVAAGDQDAIVVLFERYSSYALKIALFILKDRGEAQDVVQETFLELHRTADRFDPLKGSVSNWVFRIAAHAALDRKEYLRSRQFYTVLSIEEAEGELLSESNNSLRLAPQEQKHLLREVLAVLTPAQRRAIHLKLEGFTAEQAAQRSGMSSSACENNLYRGLKKLKTLIMTARQKAK